MNFKKQGIGLLLLILIATGVYVNAQEQPTKLFTTALESRIKIKESKKRLMSSGQQEALLQKVERARTIKQGRTEQKIQQFTATKQAITADIKRQNLTRAEQEQIQQDLQTKRDALKAINDSLDLDLADALDRELTTEQRSVLEQVEPNYLYESQTFAPDDTLYPTQWGLQYIGVDGIPENSQNSTNVIVAVVDAGVDFTHSDLDTTKWTDANCVDESNIPIPGGCMDGGYDYIDDDTDPYPVNNIDHGTSVASILGAETNNTDGMASVGQNEVTIMSVRACCDGNGLFPADAIADGIRFAVNNGAQIINASFGGATYSQQILDAITYARDNDVIVVAAAGNYSSNNDTVPIYPANYNVDNIVSVAATTSWDHLAYFSNYGQSTVDIGAPGQDVQVAEIGDQYTTISGTSFSAPLTAGVLAQIRQGNSDTYTQAINTLYTNVETESALTGEVNGEKILRFYTTPPAQVCGNAVIESPEQCDDGNTINGDGCTAQCEIESPLCGNGTVDPGEQCDDGNLVNGDGCSSQCMTEVPAPICGNSILEGGEQCDDGNIISNDGCSSICLLESTSGQQCGNAIVEGTEQCDDGNLTDGDGCSSICWIESTGGGGTGAAGSTTGSIVFHHADHLTGGSVDTDESGDMVQLLGYYPFGATRVDEHAVDYENDYRFTGQELDADTGLYYYGSRYYAADIGRFISVDPWEGDITAPQTLNKYSYTVNNPVNYTDPTGEIPQLVILAQAAEAIADAGATLADGLTTTVSAGVAMWSEINNDWAGQQEAWGISKQSMGDTGISAASIFIPGASAAGMKAAKHLKKAKVLKKKSPVIRNKGLAGKSHPKTGVPFDKNGFPDFSNYLYKDGANDVMIKYGRNHDADIRAANKAADYKSTPEGYTWHHHQDEGRMQLVERRVHSKTGHTGGASLHKSKGGKSRSSK